MEIIVELFKVANTLSPLAIIGLLVGLLYYVTAKHKEATKVIETIRGNDLHELPEMAATLRRMEVSQEKHFAVLVQNQSYFMKTMDQFMSKYLAD